MPQPDPLTPPKSKLRKYDKRAGNAKNFGPRKAAKLPKGKPIGAKNLSHRTAYEVLRKAHLQETLLELIRGKDKRLAFEVVRYCWDRLEGKAFVAVNPDTEPSGGHILNQDNRLQVAVSNLIVQASDSKGSKTRKRDQLVLEASSAQSGDRAQSADNKDFVGFDDVG